MVFFEKFAADFSNIVWGLPLVFLLFGSGIVFTVMYGFPQLRYFKHALHIVMGRYGKNEVGEISSFNALCAALSATVGLGNIAGVAIAISAGGPGAVFWLWVAGFLGMATKFTEVSLALMHRKMIDGQAHGGPMYTMLHGLSKNKGYGFIFVGLAWFYAFFIILSSFGAGNMFQANQMASVLRQQTGIPEWCAGLVFCVLAGLILIGGIKRIGQVASKLVPIMISIYMIAAIGILISNWREIPSVFYMIFTDAFTGTAATGGFLGVLTKEVIVQGVRRAVFSNEAGMGSATIAHSAAKSKPVQEGSVALLEPFIDTLVVCSITALAILVTGAWHTNPGVNGSELTAFAFSTIYGNLGGWIVTLTVVLFAFSTIISWSYYGEQGAIYIFGKKGIKPFRYLFILFIFIGSIWKLSLVLNLSDAVFGLLAVPNLLACLLLSGKLRTEVKKYYADLKAGKID